MNRISLEQATVPSWNPQAITAGRNALGRKPERVLFLWPFARPMNLRAQVIGHGWAQIGPVHLLLRPGLGLMRNVLSSMDDVHQHLGGLSDAPGKLKAPQLRFGDGVWGRYQGYPVDPLTVSDQIWRDALATLVGRCGHFVADLTSKRESPGLDFEMELLFSRVSLSRIVLLVDSAQANQEVCVRFVEDCWRTVGQRGNPPPLLSYDSQAPEYVRKAFKGAFSGGSGLAIAGKALSALGRA